MIKCELVVGGYSYQVTDDVANWDDVVLSLKRGDYDGVVRSFTSKFEFVNGAHALLKKQYRDNYLDAAASVVISRRNNSWGWNELFRCTLDFSTYEDSGNAISINAVDDSLASLIKAKKGTQYEYSVNEVKEDNQLYYDRIGINNSALYYPYDKNYDVENPKEPEGDEVIINTNGTKYYQLPLSFSDSSEIYNGTVVEILDHTTTESYGAIMEFKGTQKVIISMKFHVRRSEHSAFSINFDIIEGSSSTVVGKFYIGSGDDFDVDYSFEIPSRYTSSGNKLRILFPGGGYKSWVAISKFEYFKVTYSSVDSPVNIDVVSPTKILCRLLQSMNGGKEGITGEIEGGYDERVDNCMIVAAESARGIKNAKLYSSFNKFTDWMKSSFGYVYGISGDKVTFRHRTKYFANEVVKEIGAFDDFLHSVNSSLIYSRVRVGYEKQDYDSINGRDEFRFTNTFSTGITLTDNSLDLISPYRADAYGIEFLVQKMGKDTTDTNSDNDVFFVGVELVKRQVVLPGGIATILHQYELMRGGKYSISGVISVDTMFNAMYSPRQMLLANKGFIGCCTERLTYTSGEGNSDVAIGGVKEKDDVLISKDERLITVGELSFNTPEFEIPDNQNGLVALIGNGEKYVGYIQKADMNVGHEECTKFTLSLKRVE